MPNDALPGDFAKIPDDSPKENVKASVAGTPQAKEALITNAIPADGRGEGRRRRRWIHPKYDGEPKLAPIEGTPISSTS